MRQEKTQENMLTQKSSEQSISRKEWSTVINAADMLNAKYGQMIWVERKYVCNGPWEEWENELTREK